MLPFDPSKVFAAGFSDGSTLFTINDDDAVRRLVEARDPGCVAAMDDDLRRKPERRVRLLDARGGPLGALIALYRGFSDPRDNGWQLLLAIPSHSLAARALDHRWAEFRSFAN